MRIALKLFFATIGGEISRGSASGLSWPNTFAERPKSFLPCGSSEYTLIRSATIRRFFCFVPVSISARSPTGSSTPISTRPINTYLLIWKKNGRP